MIWDLFWSGVLGDIRIAVSVVTQGGLRMVRWCRTATTHLSRRSRIHDEVMATSTYE